jgi:hypothetical protein
MLWYLPNLFGSILSLRIVTDLVAGNIHIVHLGQIVLEYAPLDPHPLLGLQPSLLLHHPGNRVILLSVLWNRNWNLNRRNRNFLPCGTGNGTEICQKVGTGTVF